MEHYNGETSQSSHHNRLFEIPVEVLDQHTIEQPGEYFRASSPESGVEIPQPDNARTIQQWTDLNPYRELYMAALRGNWKAAEAFLARNPDAVRAKVAMFSETALHVAASEGHSEFVENMLELMSPEEASEPDHFGRTALHDAAYAGSLSCAIALVNKYRHLTNIVDPIGSTPLLFAALYSFNNKDLLWYLCLVTKSGGPFCPFTGALSSNLCLTLAAAGHLDILLYLLESYENLATVNARTILSTLSAAPFHFLSSSGLGPWERRIYSCLYNSFSIMALVIHVSRSNEPPIHIKSIVEDTLQSDSSHVSRVSSASISLDLVQELHWTRRLLLGILRRMTPSFFKRLQDAKLRHHGAVDLVQKACTEICKKGSFIFNHVGEFYILRDATHFGITEIVKIMLEFCPDLIWHALDQDHQSLLHYSILSRREEIFNLFSNSMTCHKAGPVSAKRTLLHLAAKLAPLPQLTVVSGAALQMQRELQWFKAIERSIPPLMVNHRNADMETPQEIFTREHKSLAEAGERWMKDTSNSCMIVSTLIATFVFAAAFTVPGGNNDKGSPIFLWTSPFLLFVISDALALFSSVTSLLIFFSILTARYAEEDFHTTLPKKLVIGLAALFLSIAMMTTAFGATLYIVLNERIIWISVPITLLASFPVSIFIVLQFPLFIQLFRSTFGNSIFNPQSPW